MTQSELKELTNLGAELGAAKAENEGLRGLLTTLRVSLNLDDTEYGLSQQEKRALAAEIDAALSQQPEPTDTFTAVDMATAAAQGLRDGQAAVGQAAAQDERWAVHAQGPDELYAAFSREDAEQHAAALNTLSMPAGIQVSAIVVESPWPAAEHWKYLAEQERDHVAELRARATRPAQTEQQPAGDGAPPCWWIDHGSHGQITQRQDEAGKALAEGKRVVRYTSAPIAQTEQQPVAWRRVVERLIANVEILDHRPRPMCRDCADCNGVCDSGLDCDIRGLIEEARAMLAAPIAQTAPQHPDDEAVDRFAVAMKAKLAASREKGRHGWQNATAPHLSALLYDHLYKADPLDVGNLAMMLHQNGQAIELPQEARGRKQTVPQPEQSGLVLPRAQLERIERRLTDWLDLICCECESGHSCGRNEVTADRDAIRAALSAQGAGDASA